MQNIIAANYYHVMVTNSHAYKNREMCAKLTHFDLLKTKNNSLCIQGIASSYTGKHATFLL